MNIKKRILSALFIALSVFPMLIAQIPIDTLSSYNSLNECTYISPLIYPQQMARIIPERPGKVTGFILHAAGEGIGSCKVRILGHEGGDNLPQFLNALTPSITVFKAVNGEVSIPIILSTPVDIENDQFYIALDSFTADFGLKQDASYYPDFCMSNDGGNYYPTLLRDVQRKWAGENCSMTMDVFMKYIPTSSPMFKDITRTLGIPPNIPNKSIAWGDIDNDNWLDLLIGGQLYHNQKGRFKNISKQLPNLERTNVRSTAFVDMDNDGDQDILLLGKHQSAIYINGGAGTFSRKNLKIPPLPSLHAYSIADINKDRYPDLVVAQLWGTYPVPLPNYLFLNNKKLDFKDITRRLYPKHKNGYNYPKGIACEATNKRTYLPNRNKNRRSRGTQFTDFDLDGDMDLYITNYYIETDEFYQNKGKGRFKRLPAPKALKQRANVSNHGTGVDWYDYDNDGDFDLLLPQLAHPRYVNSLDHRGTTIYRNDNGRFTDLVGQHGIQFEETHAGASFGDMNNDGLVDIVTTVYYGCRYIDIYLQQPDHTFKLNTYQSGLSKLTTGDDACFVDFNNDGLLDLAMGNKGKFRLYQNVQDTKNAWLKIQVISTSNNHFGIGTIVKIYTKEHTYTQEINAGRGQRMQKPMVLHFGLGDATTIEKIEVHWGKNHLEVFEAAQVNAAYTLVEGEGL